MQRPFDFFSPVNLQAGVPVGRNIRRAWLDVVAVLAAHVAGGVVIASGHESAMRLAEYEEG